MARSRLLAGIRVASAVLLVIGLAGVAVGAYSELTYDCDTGTYYDAQRVEPAEAASEPVPFADLPPDERVFFEAALNGSVGGEGGPSSPPGDLADRVVEHRGSTYRLVSYHADCAGNWMVGFAFLGAPLAVLGSVGLVSVRLLEGPGTN